ncbi:General substrate transporter [Mycena indigotica]|uniref:General substrate transporter n=1 Tax=Mycena indigotica TaxID=2126181 RepID=A0A8H6S102_9AGAR|nr:General substrate transporter [Mycena indigotica]KAF7289315.1 General substrate transporter [Mycena indigotica]
METFAHKIVDDSMNMNPSGSVFVYTQSDQLVTINHLEYGRATHRAAHLLRPGNVGKDGDVVAIIALSDTILWQAVIVGLIRATQTPFPISHRNSPPAIALLIVKNACHRVLSTCITLRSLIQATKEEISKLDSDFVVDFEEMPSIHQLYPHLGIETAQDICELYPTESAFKLDDVCLILHSSGSTGFPKPILHSHRGIMQRANLGQVTEMRNYFSHPIATMHLPAFHLAGLIGHLLQPIFANIPAAVFPPTAMSREQVPMIPTPDNILHHAQQTNCKVIFTFPFLLIAWAKSPESMELLRKYELVCYSGGFLPPRIGQRYVEAGINLRSVYGMTEFGSISSLLPLPGDELDWEWFRILDRATVRWIPRGNETFECHVLTTSNHQPSVENLDGVKGFATSDLFMQHPTKKHLWKMLVLGRANDVIVHTTGEKTVPQPIEEIINSSALVNGSVMFGHGHDCTGILIELTPQYQIDIEDPVQVAELRNKLWPIISEANDIAPKFSRIFKEMIIIVGLVKPLPRAAKGTVMRAAALEVYAEEIEAIYEAIAAHSIASEFPVVPTKASISLWLVQLASDLVPQAIMPESNIFEQGFDSLSATILRLRVIAALKSNPNLVYTYPEILGLASFLVDAISGLVEKQNTSTRIQALFDRYTANLIPSSTTIANVEIVTVLLTGSTGGLGSEILSQLLQDPRITKIYALNRPMHTKGSLQRQADAFHVRGLDITGLNAQKLVFIEAHAHEPDLGVDVGLYKELKASVSHIIHNAWSIDFNASLASFEPHLQATRNLVDLALSGKRTPCFLFMSSIMSAFSWDFGRGPCPEDFLPLSDIETCDCSSSTGYGESKFVAEQIVRCKRFKWQLCTVGSNMWLSLNRRMDNDGLAADLGVSDSIQLKPLLTPDENVDWIDPYTCATKVVELLFATTPSAPAMHNFVHPQPVAWATVAQFLCEAIALQFDKTLELIPFDDWLAELEKLGLQGAIDRKALVST